MRPLYCYDDEEGWGRALLDTAIASGIEAHLFNATDVERVPAGAVAFVHMHHSKAWNGRPERRERDKGVMIRLELRGVLTIPCPLNAAMYDNKRTQAAVYGELMPATFCAADPISAVTRRVTLPMVSKSSQGAGSNNVRLLRTEADVEKELRQVFGDGEKGIPLRYGERQRGYVLWQEFLPNNPYDYRVIRIGDQRMILRRWNRDDVPFASGSGRIEPIATQEDLTEEVREVLASANRFFEESGFTWSGIDLVRDDRKTGIDRWRFLECTVGWTMAGYADCAMLSADGTVSDRTGSDVWDVLLDELTAGRMGVPW